MILTIESACFVITDRIFPPKERGEWVEALGRYCAIWMDIERGILRAMEAGAVRPRHPETRRYDDSQRSLGSSAHVDLDEAIEALRKDGAAIPDDPARALESTPPAPAQPADDPCHQEEAGAAVNEPQQDDSASRAERIRADALSIEIDDAVFDLERQGGRPNAATVMELLRARAGRPDSCVVTRTPDGLMWLSPSTGKTKELTQRALHKRITGPASPRR